MRQSVPTSSQTVVSLYIQEARFMLKYNYPYIIFMLLIGQISCNDGTTRNCNEEQGLQTQITKIKYGTSFGYCIGYCWKQIVITNDELEFEKKNREDEPVNCDRNFSCAEWLPITNEIDLGDFLAMDETIGCPDCADDGAEWIEIQSGFSTHKVTFEYMAPPTQISAYVSSLRELMRTFDNCD